MKLVAARLRDDVDDAAERPAVLGLVAAGLDLDLLTNSLLIALPWMPLSTLVVLTPSMIHWFSAEVAP